MLSRAKKLTQVKMAVCHCERTENPQYHTSKIAFQRCIAEDYIITVSYCQVAASSE